jgi:hypothetical protein
VIDQIFLKLRSDYELPAAVHHNEAFDGLFTHHLVKLSPAQVETTYRFGSVEQVFCFWVSFLHNRHLRFHLYISLNPAEKATTYGK